MILILTGPVRSHKTTTLLRWTENRNDCGGILTPDEDGMRMLYNVREKKSISYQINEKISDDDMIVGRFIFSSEGFLQAGTWLRDHLLNPSIHYLILDEIGPLELAGGGWDNCVKHAIPVLGEKNLILVVRRKLLEEVIQHYELKEYRIVEKDYFLSDGTKHLTD
ncbi:MAG: nucleoside-triphosphatase [Saprospiraceae bacterium]